jgi:tetratricopeptide (TPR) repeat protein
VLSCSYRVLSPDVARLFRLLGVAPGPDIGLLAVASLAAVPAHRARSLLRELASANLVHQHVPGRYRMHDLVRLYAAELDERDRDDHAGKGAVRRLVDYYLQTAYSGDRLLYPHRPPIQLEAPAPGCIPQTFEHRAAAMAWFDTEHACLLAIHRLAVRQSWDTVVWKLAWALTIFHWRRGHLRDHLAVWEAGLAAAERLDDPIAEAEAHRLFGHAFGQLSMLAEAHDQLERALRLSEELGDVFGQAHTHQLLAWVWEQKGESLSALAHADQCLQLAQGIGNPVWEAAALNMLGWCHAQVGSYEQARTCCERSLVLHREQQHRDGEADTLDSLGYIAHQTGELGDALRYYDRAYILRRDAGDTYAQATILEHLGEAHDALGHRAEARDVWRQALDLCRAQHRVQDAQRIQDRLDAGSDSAAAADPP